MPADFVTTTALTRDFLALESFNLKPIAAKLMEALPNIRGAFSKMFGFIQDEKPVASAGLLADQSKVIDIAERNTYMEIRHIKIQVPQGLEKTLLQALQAQLAMVKHVQGAYHDVLQPYVSFLAQVAGHDGSRLASSFDTKKYAQLEENREAIIKQVTDCFGKTNQAYTRLGDVISRNAELPEIYRLAKECSDGINSITPQQVKQLVRQAADYLDVLMENLATSDDKKASHEFALYLSEGAQQVAKEIELYSLTHYRVLALVNCVEELGKTLMKIHK